jgi:four helix bundle protein
MLNPKQTHTDEGQNTKPYDLGQRTLEFAKSVRAYVHALPEHLSNGEYSRQLVRSSGSVGANYIEAEEALSKKDFSVRIKISRKEAKESRYWLELTEPRKDQESQKAALMQETTELMKIFGSIVTKAGRVP